MTLTKVWSLIPGLEHPEGRTLAWRLIVTLLIVSHIMRSYGMIPTVPGFVNEARAQEIERKVDANTDAMGDLERTVICNNIESELARLRSELRNMETKIFEAEQTDNMDLRALLMVQINDISDDIGDQVEKRRSNSCTVQ